ncbi:hypothetical protein ACFPFX_25800 [Streptomyces mauvecolor]|uniref:Uncharacterized protein n=1 Tax=Streptomyces mauvecolor TaxID=58345 RepID=A0ABV9UTW2_9ACTN
MSDNRARCIMRVFFHPGPDHQADQDAVFGQLLVLVEDFTPRYQARPQDLAVDLDLTGSLRYLEGTPYEAGQVLALRALALHGAVATIGTGGSVAITAMAAAVHRTRPHHRHRPRPGRRRCVPAPPAGGTLIATSRDPKRPL